MMKNFHITIKNSNKLGTYDSHFLLKLSTLMENGFTMYDALRFLLEQYDVLKAATKEEAEILINNGEKLSNILKVLGFRKSIIIQVTFAEIHGEMINNLKESALYLENRRKTFSKLIKSIQYPLLLVSIFIVMLIILNYTVIPQFQSLYNSIGTEAEGVVSVLTIMLELLPNIVIGVIAALTAVVMIIIIIIKFAKVETQVKILLKVP